MVNNTIDNGGVKGAKYSRHHLCIVLFPLRIFVFWRGDNDMIEPLSIFYFLFNFITPLSVICKIQIFRNIWASMDFLVIYLEHSFQGNHLFSSFFFCNLILFWFWFDFDLFFFEFSLILIFLVNDECRG